jgi:hypothetical protein
MKTILLALIIFITISGFGQNIANENKTKFFTIKNTSNKEEFVLFFTENQAIFKVYKNDYGVCTDGNCKVYFEFNELENGKRITQYMYNWDKFNCKGDYSISLDTDTTVSPFSKKSDLPSYQLYQKLSKLSLYAVIFETETTYKYPLIRIYVDKKNSLEIKDEVLKRISKIQTIDSMNQKENDSLPISFNLLKLNKETDSLKETQFPNEKVISAPEIIEVETEDKHYIIGRTLSIVVYLHEHFNFTEGDTTCFFYMVENEPYFSKSGGLTKNDAEILLSTMIALNNKINEKSAHDVKITIKGNKRIFATANYNSKSGKWNGAITIDYRHIEMTKRNLNKLIPIVEKAIRMMY